MGGSGVVNDRGVGADLPSSGGRSPKPVIDNQDVSKQPFLQHAPDGLFWLVHPGKCPPCMGALPDCRHLPAKPLHTMPIVGKPTA